MQKASSKDLCLILPSDPGRREILSDSDIRVFKACSNTTIG